MKDYPSWESWRGESISSLESLADDLEKFAKEEAVVSGVEIGGAVGMLGALLVPFTFGASAALAGVGAMVSVGSSVGRNL